MQVLYNKNKIKGFTLIELLVVITIIGILGAIIYFTYNSYIQKSKLSHDKINVKQYNDIIDIYLINNVIDKERIISTDIRDIIKQVYGKEYLFTPKSKDFHYWYNIEDNTIVLEKISNIKELKLNEYKSAFYLHLNFITLVKLSKEPALR